MTTLKLLMHILREAATTALLINFQEEPEDLSLSLYCSIHRILVNNAITKVSRLQYNSVYWPELYVGLQEITR